MVLSYDLARSGDGWLGLFAAACLHRLVGSGLAAAPTQRRCNWTAVFEERDGHSVGLFSLVAFLCRHRAWL